MTQVLISFDSTGSMSPCIHEVRQRVRECMGELFSRIPNLEVALINHGDYCDGDNMLQFQDFTTERGRLEHFINTSRNTDGGDGDEFYEYVLRAISRLDWHDEKKAIIMIGDALPHEPGYKYAGRNVVYRTEEKWEDVAAELGGMGIRIYAVQALDRRHSDYFWSMLAYQTNGRHVPLYQFSDSVEMLIASTLHATNAEAYTEYTNKIQVNRSIAAILAGLETKPEKPERDAWRRGSYATPEPRKTYADTRFRFSVPDGLVPVEPSRFQMVTVSREADIRSFVEGIGARFRPGRGFYELTKKETLRVGREVILRNRITGDMFTGKEARERLGIPFSSMGDIRPKAGDEFQVFVQSTSYTRKLVSGTKFMYEVE